MINKKILAFIPARGGSKRIPKKNIKNIAGKPLIAYSIEAALKSKKIDKIIVSTDDEEIARIAKEYGAEVIMRPLDIAGDNSPTEEAMIHTIKELEKKGYTPDYIVLLQPTSPLRGNEIVDKAIEKALFSDADTVLSVCEMQHYYLSGVIEEGIYKQEYTVRPMSQDMPVKYRENGAIFVTKTEVLLKNNNRLGNKLVAVVMNPLNSIDIDNIEDFELSERMLPCLKEKEDKIQFDKKELSKIKMILFDVDGIFTDGSVYLDKEGHESLKFSRIDGKGIELLRNKGMIIGVVSSEDSDIVRKRMNKLEIKEIHLGIKDKLAVYTNLKNKYDIKDEEVCYCGDDIQDFVVMEKVGYPCCPKNSHKLIIKVSKYFSNKHGGEGFVREICEQFI
ncbi:acylneuraminate cytidylyltransferase [Candidatus Woesearchaeota archaeon]|jgi:YrbI family 3-deoxy-D-manno-octulosonate 8-phosphate phosphatase|nr:acylneuraminate cytidylyltransferase [Candidatus Woesearchaeota archaeon]MBT5273103.1 acylneuraminate cytidylyltransferase [Candidatus Woesearchaeota archaeon]MBT6041766.1 acylneuraminate cytidylyltransferase [Candidatus Woesearchaeota archaeon]MBT6337582.1 acylneuraminate cytidylyltransferase [Candidatus Woesearchaeota archaeon]MBT7927017.1 acylneuraminate cytidylyltransferase [Candidatus Woesearchaeota archaeon]